MILKRFTLLVHVLNTLDTPRGLGGVRANLPIERLRCTAHVHNQMIQGERKLGWIKVSFFLRALLVQYKINGACMVYSIGYI